MIKLLDKRIGGTSHGVYIYRVRERGERELDKHITLSEFLSNWVVQTLLVQP